MAERRVDVVVGLGSRMASLEAKGTRWREVLTAWAADPRVASLTLLDYPRFGPRPAVTTRPSWLVGTQVLDVVVLGRQATGPETGLGWRVTARRLRRALPGSGSRRVVVAAAPFWVPLLPLLPAQRRGLDGVDDWRAFDAAANLRGRVVQGYAAAERLDAVTTVSAVLAERLALPQARVVGNGVHRRLLGGANPSRDPRLPGQPFAVYVGNVEQRVDLDLLEAVAARVPVVVAGPAEGAVAERLSAGALLWLGPVHADEVPSLLARAAVGLVPHRRTALTESMDPMKLLEYLGAGLPVVSTPLPGVDRWSGVRAAEGEAFVSAVEAAMTGGRLSVPEELVDWTDVADTLLRTHAGALL